VDADRFDALARSLTSAGSRRRALVATLGGALGALELADPDAASAAQPPKCKRKPGECERCQRGKCERKNGDKHCKAGKIKAKAFGTPCSVGSCQNGACIAEAPTCTRLQETCSSSAQCCSSTANCADNLCGTLPHDVCCQLQGEPCQDTCDCCFEGDCIGGECVEL
jgi:hypothetical protein